MQCVSNRMSYERDNLCDCFTFAELFFSFLKRYLVLQNIQILDSCTCMNWLCSAYMFWNKKR